jgi:hypothetical protein
MVLKQDPNNKGLKKVKWDPSGLCPLDNVAEGLFGVDEVRISASVFVMSRDTILCYTPVSSGCSASY